jgi:hypothetical protein
VAEIGITGIWEAEEEIPWTAGDGTGFRGLADQAHGLMRHVGGRLHAAAPAEYIALADKAGQLCLRLEELARSELAVNAIFQAGARDERRRYRARHAAPRRRRYLSLRAV